MAGIMASVDQRTQLAGRNRMELLLFRMNGRQRFGINVFKVREVLPVGRLNRLPHAHPAVRGVAHIRGKTVSVIDLNMATSGIPLREGEKGSIIITEYNRTVQGFLVAAVDRIINMNWQDVLPPPSGGANSYMTAVAKVEQELVQIVDVEKVLAEINAAGGVNFNEEAVQSREDAGAWHVLVADDSVVARNQIKRTLERIGVEVTLANDGEQALKTLKEWSQDPESPFKRLLLVISDIEMPRMDGYTLTRRIRDDDELMRLHVLLHTSLSGVFNKEMVQRVGADDFLAKFHPEELAEKVNGRLEQMGQAV
ncbi:chemotaxis protein CheV [Alkalilimnicola sp. S0819]|uniref:chemotaxis protein CheV n=1 Tax=Alkalilimnicola sp. S0819 TaxID=2613922 RepID=UPI0012625407|nr:chemotaxis protein CheV [Alkalilimnicola sp. S0819]KAB7627203.1 chemotaxis protein CheV [Alkalilimnicola sp. S0819]MPQ15916.1 response regulator [Alkalilimnicola sp. S0819]